MWKNELRIKNTPTMRTNLKKVPKKPEKTNCFEELQAMKSAIRDKLYEKIQILQIPPIGDYTFDFSGVRRHFKKEPFDVDDEFYCKVLECMKKTKLGVCTFEFGGKEYEVHMEAYLTAKKSPYRVTGIRIIVQPKDFGYPSWNITTSDMINMAYYIKTDYVISQMPLFEADPKFGSGGNV